MAEFNTTHVLHGSNGTAWFNGKKLTTLQSIEAKIAADYEDINVCGDQTTYRIYNGYSGEGSFTVLKIDSDVLKLMSEAYASGVMPEITIISVLQQKGTNKVERVALTEVTIDEMNLIKYEKKSKIEEEVTFKFGHFEVLETL